MRVTVHVESDEATVLGIGFKNEPGFNYGYEVDLPIPELVAYTKARDEWQRVQERLTMIYKAKIKRHNKVLRRISKRFRKKKKEL
ncbi:MAG: hypothetical protein KF865_03305 [Bdellovibrionaceae bacterium]|nr:hypothetical protein [Pseudobdellovibrionaceae bacterium]